MTRPQINRLVSQIIPLKWDSHWPNTNTLKRAEWGSCLWQVQVYMNSKPCVHQLVVLYDEKYTSLSMHYIASRCITGHAAAAIFTIYCKFEGFFFVEQNWFVNKQTQQNKICLGPARRPTERQRYYHTNARGFLRQTYFFYGLSTSHF